MSEQNKATMRHGIEEVWNRGNFDVADEIIARDFVAYTPGQEDDIHGPEGVKQYIGALRAAFPDLNFTIEDQIAEEDRVVARWVARGTHQAAFNGIPPTGKRVEFSGLSINRFANGKVVEGWMHPDRLGLLQQLDVLKAPEPTG